MMKMLVGDDDPAWRARYRMGFEGGLEVFEAVDGLDALAALDRVRPDIDANLKSRPLSKRPSGATDAVVASASAPA